MLRCIQTTGALDSDTSRHVLTHRPLKERFSLFPSPKRGEKVPEG
ncbi:hypothetical protein BN59_02924 [Legionella massiliensis]|uniref:Uncharacterized protein n=1 Tax=Legionella massiliensis TaxID=1034943 RepID=A0A078L3B7_9GAMM|nr:hypothetical protein BN59_02924 [Legionella massiliensis]CEE14352.1 hypothetical protein BN1094_02924 [Legionella massiliensis]